jgi:DNA (cytosine-5)-methyltransferase 1
MPSASRPLLLDLFSGAGGAAVGYYRAGFDIIGVDLHPMPRYPFEFIGAEALIFLEDLIADDMADHFDAIHASPPCQRYSPTRTMHNVRYPDVINPLRALLKKTQIPYIIENVPEAPMENPVILCGSQFDLCQEWSGEFWRGDVYLKRHRAFEVLFPVPDAGLHDHTRRAVTVAGHGRMGKSDSIFKGKGFSQLKRDVMRIGWMTENELNEAIPPAYTQYVGQHLMRYLETDDG